jgi:hypothetical protein
MYSKFIPLLFVGFAHNLRIESFVSVLGKLEKAHPNAASQLIDFMFTYRTDREHERECTTRPQPLGQALVLQLALAQALVVPWWDLALAQGSTKAHQGLAQGTTKAWWVPW